MRDTNANAKRDHKSRRGTPTQRQHSQLLHASYSCPPGFYKMKVSVVSELLRMAWCLKRNLKCRCNLPRCMTAIPNQYMRLRCSVMLVRWFGKCKSRARKRQSSAQREKKIFKLGEWKDQIINRRVFLGAQKVSVSAISTALTWAA